MDRSKKFKAFHVCGDIVNRYVIEVYIPSCFNTLTLEWVRDSALENAEWGTYEADFKSRYAKDFRAVSRFLKKLEDTNRTPVEVWNKLDDMGYCFFIHTPDTLSLPITEKDLSGKYGRLYLCSVRVKGREIDKCYALRESDVRRFYAKSYAEDSIDIQKDKLTENQTQTIFEAYRYELHKAIMYAK